MRPRISTAATRSSGGDGTAGDAFLEESTRDLLLDDLPVDRVHLQGLGPRFRGDRFDDLPLSGEADRDAVAGGVAHVERAIEERGVEDRTALVLGVVVRAVAALDHPEPLPQQLEGRAVGVRRAALEPAQSPGAATGEHGTALERLEQE